MNFKHITPEAMKEIWPYLSSEQGRTTDFSYGGILMWADFFNYDYCIINDTLFIRGRMEDNRDEVAFSMPVGKMNLSEAVEMLRDHCRKEGIPCRFSAIPAYALAGFEQLQPAAVTELRDWADYLYEAEKLAALTGKKMSKKRNHVNRFMADNPDWELLPITPENVSEAKAFLDSLEAPRSDMEAKERNLTRALLDVLAKGDPILRGAILKVPGKTLGFTIGDIKGDTLYIHVEKANKDEAGCYEMLNKAFAERMTRLHPEIKYINREDGAGDPGIISAKESYHPVDLLKKYNICLE